MEKSLILTFFVVVVIVSCAKAQEMKYGKISKSEIELKSVDFDPDAEAVILEEYSINNFAGGVLHNKYHKRVKILKESGTRLGDVVISYYNGSWGVQTITRLSARIVNFEGGLEKEIKLSKKDFFYVDGNNGTKEIRFTFPEVKVGSIIEYKFQMQDRAISYLSPWLFQNSIPTLKSTYSIKIPNYLNFRLLSQGERVSKINAKQYDGMYKWVLTDIHRVKEEPLAKNFLDYLERLDFQLGGHVSTTTSGLGGKSFRNTYNDWQELTGYIFETDNFSSYLYPTSKQKNTFYKSKSSDITDLEKVKEIYSYVKENFESKTKYGTYPRETLKTVLEEKEGSRASINLLLLSQLRFNGLTAYPVLISSKGHGRSVIFDTPFYDQFTNLLVLVELEGKQYFLDTFDDSYSFGYLPLEFHVDKVYVMKDEDSGLSPFLHHHRSGINQMGTIKINENNKLQANITIRFSEYDAINQPILRENSGPDKFEKEVFNNNGELLDVTISEKEDSKKIMDVNILGKEVDLGKSMLMISPFNYLRWNENPLIADTRTFPIDIQYAFNDHFSTVIDIPEGYELDDYPEHVEVVIPGNLASFTYGVEPIGNTVKVSSSINFKQSLIPAELYPELKYFLGLVISKLQEPVILKKSDKVAALED